MRQRNATEIAISPKILSIWHRVVNIKQREIKIDQKHETSRHHVENTIWDERKSRKSRENLHQNWDEDKKMNSKDIEYEETSENEFKLQEI